MTKKKEEIVVEQLAPIEVVPVEPADPGYAVGYEAARRDALRHMLTGSDNPAVLMARVLHWAGEIDGVLNLSAVCKQHEAPTHVVNRLKDIARQDRRMSVSPMPPFRIVRNS